MNFQDIKDQITEKVEIAWEKLQENPHFNTFREKYEVLPQTTQRIIVFGIIGAISFGLVMIPVSYISDSYSYSDEFEKNRLVTRELLKTASQPDFRSPPPLSFSSLSKQIKKELESQRLIETQIGEIKPGEPFKAKYVSSNINQVNAAIQVSKINLRQIFSIGTALQNLRDSLKMTGLDITANSDDNHYYDVVYELTHFSFPEEDDKEENKDSNKKSNKSNRKSKKRR